MTRQAPYWAEESAEPDIIAKASQKMTTDIARERQHIRGIGHLPVDQKQAGWELSQEERARRSSHPRTRRWRALDKLDAEIDHLNAKHADAMARLQVAEQTLSDAPEQDAKSLAAWLAAGERGKRPEATLYERERERDAARLLVEAVQTQVDEALERRLRHVERHRPKMLEDARTDVDAARAKLVAKVAELPPLREDLLAARETLLWAASFPEPDASFGFPSAVALGLRAPVEETLQTKALIDYSKLVLALGRDAEALASAFSREQAERLGIAKPGTPLDTAMWDADVDPAWKREQLERARELASYSLNPHQVADEARDFRPDP